MIKETELISFITSLEIVGYYLAMQSNTVLCRTTDFLEDIDITKLIEIRVFNKHKEFKAVRGTLGNDFQYRILEGEFDNSFSEEHYISIDSTKHNLTTIGGGSFELPVSNVNRIKIINYLTEDEIGIYHISDFRIADFIREDE